MRYSSSAISDSEFRLRQRHRAVFETEAGQAELFDLLHDMGLFRTIKPEELVMRNKAVIIADEIGLFDEDMIRKFISDFYRSDLSTNWMSKIKKENGMDNDPFIMR